jgi:hypothetical protein
MIGCTQLKVGRLWHLVREDFGLQFDDESGGQDHQNT